MMRWTEYTATLPEAEHKRLVIALGAGLREARLASEVATGNGDADDARRHVITAIIQLRDALRMLAPGADWPPLPE